MILRIEDLDSTRSRAQALVEAIHVLAWLGLWWDEGPDDGGPSAPYVQSHRRGLYENALAILKERELVYPCTCTRAEINRMASAPHADDEGPTYPGTCAHRSASDAGSLGDTPFAWRFRVPDAPVPWHDIFQGRREGWPSIDGGDFLVARNGQGPSYQLAVVCDDAAMGVTQVIRGDDLIPSTPRQILVYHAFGWRIPTFGHVPLVIDADGRRLAKRDNAVRLATLRADGLDPNRLVAVLARSLGMTVDEDGCTPRDLIDRFDPARIPKERCRIEI
jgi:glutamyl-tRNA synthetase